MLPASVLAQDDLMAKRGSNASLSQWLHLSWPATN
jgi:hypothetical protein